MTRRGVKRQRKRSPIMKALWGRRKVTDEGECLRNVDSRVGIEEMAQTGSSAQ